MTHYSLITLTGDRLIRVDRARLEQVAHDTGADAVFGNYLKDGELVPLFTPLPGSVRNDFDFGPVMLVKTEILGRYPQPLTPPVFYAMWLRMLGRIVHVPEVTAEVAAPPSGETGEAQFSYVDPRNRAMQLAMEETFTAWLRETGAAVEPGEPVSHSGKFPVEASVIIPVRNRVKTVGDAIRSALGQKAHFEFNVIVVDNHSVDGTGAVIDALAAEDPRVIRIVPESTTHGIGGCWNEALDSASCGRYAVQLDSDDVYSSESTLQQIVDKFRETGAACVIGSYTLTDFDLKPIPPGLIDHSEWTDANGANNALRINGLGAPRAYFTPIARRLRFPDVSYGEDYAMVLRISREFRIGRIFTSLYDCRRWGGNSDSNLPAEKISANNRYKDWIRTVEILARRK